MSSDAEIIQELKGHSGCRVQLFRAGDKYIVRKTSASLAYNDRLSNQIQKQRRLQKLIPVACILNESKKDELVSFDMEFINGRDLQAQCLLEPVSWLYGFTNQLIQTFELFNSTRKPDDLTPRFINKVQSLATVVMENPHLAHVRDRLRSSIQVLSSATWSGVPWTECHGDLTLENIIFRSDGSITFIDVLDGDIETFWLDIAKVVFDLEIDWSLRDVLWYRAETQEARLLGMLSRYIREEILQKSLAAFPEIASHLNALKTLQAMRIVPYAKDAVTLDRLATYLETLNTRNGAFA